MQIWVGSYLLNGPIPACHENALCLHNPKCVLFNFSHQEYSIDITLCQTWYDERLRYNGSFESFVLNGDMVRQLWIPDTFFRNSKKIHNYGVTRLNHMVRIHKDGKVLYTDRYVKPLGTLLPLLRIFTKETWAEVSLWIILLRALPIFPRPWLKSLMYRHRYQDLRIEKYCLSSHTEFEAELGLVPSYLAPSPELLPLECTNMTALPRQFHLNWAPKVKICPQWWNCLWGAVTQRLERYQRPARHLNAWQGKLVNGWYRGGEVVQSGRMLAGPGSWDWKETKAHHISWSLQFSNVGDQSSQIFPSCSSSLFAFPLSSLSQIPLLPHTGGGPQAQIKWIPKCSGPD